MFSSQNNIFIFYNRYIFFSREACQLEPYRGLLIEIQRNQEADEKNFKWRAYTQGNFFPLEKAEPSEYDIKLKRSIFDVVSNSNIFVWNQFHFL